MAANKNSSRSRVQYDLSKIKGVLGEDALDVIIRSRDADLTGYINKINGLLDKHKEKSLIDGLALRIRDPDSLVDELTEEEYKILHTICLQYSKIRKVEIETLINGKLAGYLHWLHLNVGYLTGENLARYQKLKAVIESDLERQTL